MKKQLAWALIDEKTEKVETLSHKKIFRKYGFWYDPCHAVFYEAEGKRVIRITIRPYGK